MQLELKVILCQFKYWTFSVSSDFSEIKNSCELEKSTFFCVFQRLRGAAHQSQSSSRPPHHWNARKIARRRRFANCQKIGSSFSSVKPVASFWKDYDRFDLNFGFHYQTTSFSFSIRISSRFFFRTFYGSRLFYSTASTMVSELLLVFREVAIFTRSLAWDFLLSVTGLLTDRPKKRLDSGVTTPRQWFPNESRPFFFRVWVVIFPPFAQKILVFQFFPYHNDGLIFPQAFVPFFTPNK